MKKHSSRMKSDKLFIILFLKICHSSHYFHAVKQNNQETNYFSYELNDKILTITGDGYMENYTDSPWISFLFSEVVLEGNILSIGDNAFLNCYGLTSITIPNGLLIIGNHAFDGCCLVSITIPSTVTSIGELAFSSCSTIMYCEVEPDNNNYASVDGALFNYLKSELILYPPGKWESSYSVPSGVTTICSYAFSDCYLDSVIISEGVTTICDFAFYRCYSVETITISSSVTTIGPQAFRYCNKLASVTVQSGNNYYVSIDDVIFNYF